MALVTGVTLPNNGDRIVVANYNDPINAILAQINGNIDSANVATGSLPWEVMASFTNKIPSTAMQDEANLKKYRDEANIAFVASGCTWSITSGLTGAMTSGVIYTSDGARAAVSAVTSKVFTASKDTYIDISPAGVVSYSEVANGAAAPSITADYIRIAIVITSGAAITAINVTAKTSPNSKEIGRIKLGASSNTLKVENIPAKKYIRVTAILLDTGGTINGALTLNGDTAGNYSVRASNEGGADATATAQSNLSLVSATLDNPYFIVLDVINISSVEKLINGHSVGDNAAGAGNVPRRREIAGKWANTAAQVSSVTITNTGVGSYASGSELLVEGWD